MSNKGFWAILGLGTVTGLVIWAINRKPAGANPPPGTHILSILVQGQGTTSPSIGTYTINDGQVATIQAIPASGWQFTGWSNGSTVNPISLTINSDVSITAIFTQIVPINTITFGTLTGQRMQAYDVNGFYLTFFTCNLSCQVNNQGQATTRTIQVWRQYPGDIPYNVKTVSLNIPANGNAVFSYVGNPVGSGSILLQINAADIWLVDADSGAMSNKINI